jgi:2-polyprenyl-3-methyl-5-hydroxy-6-metoxy-1,4-benzoquinol methylase
VRLQVADRYNKNYDTKARFCSYWHQIDEIVTRKPTRMLEIGIGNGFVSSYLLKRGFNVLTLDIDKKLGPIVESSVLNIPFFDGVFDVVACYEVLEHLPYMNFEKALAEMLRVSSSYVLLSLPDANKVYRIYAQIPKLEFIKLIQFPRLKKIPNYSDGGHHWEIGRANYKLETVIDAIKKAGFKIERTYRAFEMPYHRFFILKK